jgi:hypothetical protein
VSDQVDATEPEMPADRFQIIDVVMDASFQLRAVGDVIRPAAIARVAEDQRVTVGERLEGVEEIDPVGDEDGCRALSQLLDEQTHSIIRRRVVFGRLHRETPLKYKSRDQARLLKQKKPRQSRLSPKEKAATRAALKKMTTE